MIEVCDIDINQNYFIDDDLNIWSYIDDFYNYHLEEFTGIKDNIETWQNQLCEEHKLEELNGKEVIKKIVKDLEETIDYYRNKYYGVLDEIRKISSKADEDI